jgi:hypothetical protein
MDRSKNDNSVISQDMWRAWAEKDKLREEATARKAKVLAGVALILMAISGGLYFYCAVK